MFSLMKLVIAWVEKVYLVSGGEDVRNCAALECRRSCKRNQILCMAHWRCARDEHKDHLMHLYRNCQAGPAGQTAEWNLMLAVTLCHIAVMEGKITEEEAYYRLSAAKKDFYT